MSLLSRKPDPRRAFLEKLWAVDAALAKQGFPAFSPWWRKQLTRFFLSDRRRWVVRVGRRGGKSTSWAKVAVAVALYGAWVVPAGDTAVVAFLSIDRGEASARLRTIAAMLAALDVEHSQRDGEIELKTRPVAFRVFAATTRAVGFTAILAICDEVARWKDVATNANPAREVVASLAPALATQPEAKLILSSSPWTTHDFHATEFDKGDTSDQLATSAATWEANPSVTEADTHALEPDPRIWSREYAAQPSDAVASFCSSEDYDACVAVGVRRRPPAPATNYRHCVDVGLRHDRTAVLTFHVELRERAGAMPVQVLVLDQITLLIPTFLSKVSIEQVEQAVVTAHSAYGGDVYSDSHYFDALQPLLKARHIVARQAAMHPSAQSARAAALQSRFSARLLDLLDHEELRKETLSAQIIHHQGGRVTVSAPDKRGAHDDILDTLLLACDADIGGKLGPSGGDLEIVPERVIRVGHRFDVIPRQFFRTINGIRLSVAAPSWAPEYAEQQNERFARRQILQSDIDELGEAEVARRMGFSGPPSINRPVR